MKADIIVIGAGASGLMAAYAAARTLVENDRVADVVLLEKMPRPGRKIMITGKGRCNFTNLKEWNEFSQHIRSKANFVKPAFYNFTSQDAISFFEGYGMPTVVERGDRAFPASHHASDAVDTLVLAAQRYGVKLVTDCEVQTISHADEFALETSQGKFFCKKLIIATGGLSYPGTGSTGDGYRWATSLGHKIQPLFPSLTALVPKGYKDTSADVPGSDSSADTLSETSLKGHLHRSLPLTEYGQMLCGNQLKNVGVTSIIEGCVADEEFGDIDFTDGGIEGPVGFQLSRKCVKSIINGSRVSIRIDLKSGVSLEEVTERVKQLWNDIAKDPRSRGLKDREKCRILLGKLIPWDLIPGFLEGNPDIITVETRKSGSFHGKPQFSSKVWVNLNAIARALKSWTFDIDGFVGYERSVVTAGGVSTDDIVAKTLESRIVPGLHFCGEVLDMDCDTGGYNLQAAFSTGFLAGQSAARSLI